MNGRTFSQNCRERGKSHHADSDYRRLRGFHHPSVSQSRFRASPTIPRGKGPKSGRHIWPRARAEQQSERLVNSDQTLPISNGTCLMMTRVINCDQMRQITFILKLESESNHNAFHQSTQYYMIVRSRACNRKLV